MRYTFDDFIGAVHEVENQSCRDGSCPAGDRGASIGPLQIGRAYHADAMSMLPAAEQFPYEKNEELAYARRTVQAYMRRHAAVALIKGDWRVCARVHNGGPDGNDPRLPNGKPDTVEALKTMAYWRKVEKALAEIERARGSGQTSGPVVHQDSNPAAAPRVVASEAVVPKKVERGLIVEKPVEVVALPAPSKWASRSLWMTILGAVALIVPPIIQALSVPPEQSAELQQALAEGDWVRAGGVAILILGYLFANAFKAWARARVVAP